MTREEATKLSAALSEEWKWYIRKCASPVVSNADWDLLIQESKEMSEKFDNPMLTNILLCFVRDIERRNT